MLTCWSRRSGLVSAKASSRSTQHSSKLLDAKTGGGWGRNGGGWWEEASEGRGKVIEGDRVKGKGGVR